MKALVICLGDLGRSPRICNAARELAEEKNTQVCLLGHVRTEIPQNVREKVTIAPLQDSRHGTFVVRQAVRCLSLILHLCSHSYYSTVLVQNPPSVSVLWILLIYRWICNLVTRSCFGERNLDCKVFVDCHNYGWTLMGVKEGVLHAVLEWLEIRQMRMADQILTVSRAMKDDLVKVKNFASDRVFVYYDLPGEKRAIARSYAFERLRIYHPGAARDCRLRIVTSTSYTADESIDWLVKAVAENNSRGLKIELIITGKGPQYDDIKKLVKQLKANCFQIFVNHEDYLPVLAACDLGVCLHRSSSGFDLPMKIIDMKRANIPILAFDYKTLKDEIPGLQFFKNQTELTERLKAIHDSKPEASACLEAGVDGRVNKSLVQCLLD